MNSLKNFQEILKKSEHMVPGNYEKGFNAFYDDWYAGGYLSEWPEHTKRRMLELIRGLGLPETGDALDYGCGNGIFTAVIKLALPKWNVYGFDISKTAVDNARKWHPNCRFFLSTDMSLMNQKFDLLFSHHVLEHVSDITNSWQEISQYLKKNASCLHVLPGGNQGSFEYGVCMLRKDGIDFSSENRFAFEARSHLRRLTTQKMNTLAAQHDFHLTLDLYANHFYGALDWVTLSKPLFIFSMLSPRKAKDLISALKLTLLCIIFLSIKVFRFPANTIEYKKSRMNKYSYYLLSSMLLIFYPLSKLINISIKHMSNLEWERKRMNKSGSEMYLYYVRSNG